MLSKSQSTSFFVTKKNKSEKCSYKEDKRIPISKSQPKSPFFVLLMVIALGIYTIWFQQPFTKNDISTTELQDDLPFLSRIDDLVEESQYSSNENQVNTLRKEVFPNGEKNLFSCYGEGLLKGCGMNDDGCQGYPQLFNSKDVMENWKPDDANRPRSYYNSLCRFNYSNSTQLSMARTFKEYDVPFIVYGIPVLSQVAVKWTDEYISTSLNGRKMEVEISKNNHFMYYNGDLTEDAPYKQEAWTYKKFIQEIQRDHPVQSNETHAYFFVSAPPGSKKFSWIQEDLQLFNKTNVRQGGDFFVTKAKKQRGIHCRFGMRGIVAEGHFDAGLNMVAMIRGSKRYILAPPSICPSLYLLQNGPSARHTTVDWSNIDHSKYPLANNAPVTEAIISAGDVLYIPSYWYHHIVSLDQSIQCNTRSGVERFAFHHLEKCGF